MPGWQLNVNVNVNVKRPRRRVGLLLREEGLLPPPLVMAAISRTTIRISWLLVTAVRLMAQYQQLTSELGALSAGAQLLTGTCSLSLSLSRSFLIALSLSFLPHRPACAKLTHLGAFPGYAQPAKTTAPSTACALARSANATLAGRAPTAPTR